MKKNKQKSTISIECTIAESVLNIFLKNRQLRPLDDESCGVLIGSRSIDNTRLWIEEITTTQPDDVVSRSSFWMKDKQHQLYVDKCFSRSSGVLGYLGTWHTHPEEDPTPSKKDYIGWKLCISKNRDRELFFIIIGNKCLRMYTVVGRKFQEIHKHVF